MHAGHINEDVTPEMAYRWNKWGRLEQKVRDENREWLRQFLAECEFERAYTGSIMAVFSLYHTLRLHLSHPGARHVVIFVVSLLAYGTELCLAVAFALSPQGRPS